MSNTSTEQLNEFIAKARGAGKTNEDIIQSLLKAGWDPDQVKAAVPSINDELVPPPPPAARTPGREVFFALLTFFTLGISAVSLGGVIFKLIDKAFPDLTVMNYYGGQSVASPLSALIVASPIFIFLSWKFIRDVGQGLVAARSGIRKILTYIALFIASATVIGDVIALVYRFLAGEVNTRFILKVITILVIGIWIVCYYWINLKREEHNESLPKKWYQSNGLALVLVVIATICGGFYLGGSPEQQRSIVRDGRRIQDLQLIYSSVQDYYARQQTMPAMSDIQQGYLNVMPVDPESGAAYEYIIGTGTSFQLCAVFETDDARLTNETTPKMIYGPYDANWTHPSGYYCFSLEAKQPKF